MESTRPYKYGNEEPSMVLSVNIALTKATIRRIIIIMVYFYKGKYTVEPRALKCGPS